MCVCGKSLPQSKCPELQIPMFGLFVCGWGLGGGIGANIMSIRIGQLLDIIQSFFQLKLCLQIELNCTLLNQFSIKFL